MKKIKLILVSMMLFSCMKNYEKDPEKERQKAQVAYDLFKNEYNLILAGNNEKKHKKGTNNILDLVSEKEELEIMILKNPIQYKSKYFKDEISGFHNYNLSIVENREIMIFTDYENRIKRQEIPFFKKPNYDLFFFVIDYYGLRPYVLNELIYDKSKGNDFEKIEKILTKYPEAELATFDEGWECGNLNKRDSSEWIPFMYVQDEECVLLKDSYKNKYDIYSIEKIKKYGEKFEKYFSKERKLEEIDWGEFLEYNNITPVINLYLYLGKTTSEEEAKRILKEISPYYNKKTFIIVLNAKDENGNDIDVW